PVAGRDHAVGGERGDDVVNDLALIEPQLRGALAVHIELERGVVQVLRDVYVADAAQAADLPGQGPRHLAVLAEVGAGDLDVNGRGQALVQDGVHHGSGLKKPAQFRQLGLQGGAHAVHVARAADLVPIVERHLHGGGVGAGVAGVERGEARDHADVGDHQLQVRERNNPADQALDLLHLLGHDFDPGARLRLEI